MTLEPPVLVTVSDRDWLLPTVTFPKLRLVGFDPSVPCVTPVPVTGMVSVGLDAVEVMVTLPLTLAADVGAEGRTRETPDMASAAGSGGFSSFSFQIVPVLSNRGS